MDNKRWSPLWILQKVLFYAKKRELPLRYRLICREYWWKIWNIVLVIRTKIISFKHLIFAVKRRNGTVILVCASDEKFAMPLTVTLKSIIMNFRIYSKLKIYILDGSVTKFDKEKVMRSLKSAKASIEWIKIDESSIKDLKVYGHVSLATYYRLLIPSLLPSEINKIIYLDSDLIANEDIGKLWEIEMDDYYMLAVQEQDGECKFISSKKGLLNYKELGLDPSLKYFNTGVLVINLDKWRKERIGSKIISYIRMNPEFIRWWDQDAFNALLSDKWGSLDLRWNLLAHTFYNPSWDDAPVRSKKEYRMLTKYPYIIHFSTGSKPWHQGCKHPYRDIFFYYLDMTEWRKWRPNLKSPQTAK